MANINIPIQPFPIPDGVLLDLAPGRKQDGFKPSPTYNLGDLDDETLGQMCDQFRESVFDLAQQQRN